MEAGEKQIFLRPGCLTYPEVAVKSEKLKSF